MIGWGRINNSVTAMLAILGVLAVVFATLLFSLLLYEQENDRREAQAALMREATALGLFLKDAALRNDYQNMQDFTTDWGRERQDMVMLTISAPNGFRIAHYARNVMVVDIVSVRHEVRHKDKILVVLDLTRDITSALAVRSDHRLSLLPWVLGFILVLAGLLWLALRRFVLLPMERTDRQLAKTASQLVSRNVELRDTLLLAEEANRSKSQFLAAMSHELRTPLNAIIGFSQVMRDEYMGKLGADPYKEYAQAIHESGEHLLELINDVLDVAKIESGSMELHNEEVPLHRIVDAAHRMIADQALAASLTVKVTMPDPSPVLDLDARRAKQILLNLLSNAVKFTAPGGRIDIEVSEDASGVVLSVKDTGIGMTTQEVGKALSPFGQVDGDLNRRFDGTGLGLPLAKELAELHGGDLQVISVPGKGTEIRVMFPATIVRDHVPLSSGAAGGDVQAQGA